jgi:hypothetical protein
VEPTRVRAFASLREAVRFDAVWRRFLAGIAFTITSSNVAFSVVTWTIDFMAAFPPAAEG